MKLVSTIKVKANNKVLFEMFDRFKSAVQYAIDKGFEAKTSNRFKLHHLVYRDIRQKFNLPADFTVEVIGKASENLKAVKLKKRPIIKQCPVSFNRKLFTFSFDKVRLATFEPRQRIDVPINIPEYYWKYLDWRYQTLELVNHKGNLFFHITFSRDVNTPVSCGDKILGVDVGINNLAVCSDGKVFKGYKTKIIQFQYLRKKLQRKGTKSAKRKLKALSGRQKRYMRWVNHNISKEIVASADTIVLENLKGIRKSRNKHMGKRLNRWLNSWSFYQLQSFIKYKAEFQGKRAVFVSPYMTSQTCSKCGKIGSRYSDSFVCLHCGYSSQSDFNASCNLRRLIVTKPNISTDDTKGQLITAVDVRDNDDNKSVKPHTLVCG